MKHSTRETISWLLSLMLPIRHRLRPRDGPSVLKFCLVQLMVQLARRYRIVFHGAFLKRCEGSKRTIVERRRLRPEDEKG